MKRSSIFFILIICVFTTLIKYQLGESDQLPQIPLIIKEMNASFLQNDFFVQANETFGPRFYYSKFMAFGSAIFSIPVWFFILSLLCSFFTMLLTFFTAQHFFRSEKISLLAALLVVSLPTPTLAESTFLVYEGIITPTALIFPLLLGAFYRFFAKNEIILPLILAGIASLFQVLYGLTTSLLLLFAYVGAGWKYGFKYFPLLKAGIAVLFVSGFAMANLYPYFTTTVSASVTTTDFVDIVAFFRNPHHYVPSYFPLSSWILSVFFFGATGFSFVHFYKKAAEKTNYFQILLITFGIAMGFIGGYIFVEIFPSRLWATGQTFRYVILLKWLGCIFLAGSLIDSNWKILAAVHPISLFFKTFLTAKLTRNVLPILGIITLLSLISFRLREDILVLASLFLLAIFHLYQTWDKKKIILGMTIITLGLAITPFISHQFLPSSIDSLLAKIYPKYGFSYQYDTGLKELSKIISEKTPNDAIILTPPNLPHIRFSANRAIVVDFKSFPYQDAYMLDWRERIYFCYGNTDLLGFEAQADLTEKFKTVSFDHLTEIKKRYKATFAVVDAENSIVENVIFENYSYKLVKL